MCLQRPLPTSKSRTCHQRSSKMVIGATPPSHAKLESLTIGGYYQLLMEELLLSLRETCPNLKHHDGPDMYCCRSVELCADLKLGMLPVNVGSHLLSHVESSTDHEIARLVSRSPRLHTIRLYDCKAARPQDNSPLRLSPRLGKIFVFSSFQDAVICRVRTCR